MGGCCCYASKGSQLTTAPAFYYCPRVLDEHVPSSSNHGAVSVLSMGVLVDTNLDTSILDAFRLHPAPMPFDMVLGLTHGASETRHNKNDRAVQTTNSGPVQEPAGVDTQETHSKGEDLKDLEGKAHSNLDVDLSKELEVELSKSIEPLILPAEEEDVCPICLDEYDHENPKLVTPCDHNFHLACILEWMERSEVYPVCDKEMVIDPPIS